MECVILIGIQASGKSTFYREMFFNTHMKINLDMLRTRYRETTFIEAALHTSMPFVVDNTNPTMEERKKYIGLAQKHRYKIVGYYFEPDYAQSLDRNGLRSGRERIPEIGIKSVMKNLQIPAYDEGFDELYRVRSRSGEFEVEPLEQ